MKTVRIGIVHGEKRAYILIQTISMPREENKMEEEKIFRDTIEENFF